MDFPLFHLDLVGNRIMFAVIAILHVLINHALAVGAIPLITLMEWWGQRTGRSEWDRLAYRILAVCFIVTTSVGALTGVGIWFSASLANPSAIGSLIRVFFWAWFFEWLVFVTEVSLIMAYFLTWKSWTGARKPAHIGLGVALSIMSWLTMAVIVAILGFMMDTGTWPEAPTFWRGVLNPIYIPQLVFRTPGAMVAAGAFALLLAFFFTRKGDGFRAQAVRFTSAWTLGWVPLCAAGAWWYWRVVPEAMGANVAVALTTQAFESWHRTVGYLILASAGVLVLVSLWGVTAPRRLPRLALVLPVLLAFALLTYFERVREFVRKPYVIGRYMYANGIRPADYPLLATDGVLAHATYTPVRTITDANRLAAGRAMFNIACTRCHTTTGVNGVVKKLTDLYGTDPWEREVVEGYLRTMHNTRPFMPPVPGTEAELAALTDYLLELQRNPQRLPGAQSVGVEVPDQETPAASRADASGDLHAGRGGPTLLARPVTPGSDGETSPQVGTHDPLASPH
ncbi:MAG TPA: cytochrome c [Phycisphaerae bacterium]|nr:cytochrome c [Phycisphaerae bacterium]HNU45184.1 cytochrome c [Phycisphaerae bacterium]